MGEDDVNKKQLWLLIAGLILLNCITVAFFLTKGSSSLNEETVASVGKDRVTRQEWLNELEDRYGQDILGELVDQKVIEQLAKKYKIKISDEAVEREFKLFQTMYSSSSKNKTGDEKKWKTQIRTSLMLEELLTKDVAVSAEEIEKYYTDNKNLFSVPTSYHLSHLIVKTKKEAEKGLDELSQGSSFDTLAMEKSIDEFSANEGGDIGFLSEEDEHYPAEYIQEAKKLKPGKWSKPMKVNQGYAIVKLHEKISGKKYGLKEVKAQIRRQIALEQMETTASARTLWDEVKVEWFYGKENKK